MDKATRQLLIDTRSEWELIQVRDGVKKPAHPFACDRALGLRTLPKFGDTPEGYDALHNPQQTTVDLGHIACKDMGTNTYCVLRYVYTGNAGEPNHYGIYRDPAGMACFWDVERARSKSGALRRARELNSSYERQEKWRFKTPTLPLSDRPGDAIRIPVFEASRYEESGWYEGHGAEDVHTLRVGDIIAIPEHAYNFTIARVKGRTISGKVRITTLYRMSDDWDSEMIDIDPEWNDMTLMTPGDLMTLTHRARLDVNRRRAALEGLQKAMDHVLAEQVK